MHTITIHTADDPRLNPYRTMHHAPQEPGFFVAEGGKVVERLLTSPMEVVSLLVEASRLPLVTDWPVHDLPLYVISNPILHTLMGNGYKSGLYAQAVRPVPPDLATFITTLPPQATLLALPNLTTPRNVGAIARVAAALGAHGLLVGESTADPWSRLAVRAAMGTAFSLPNARLHPVTSGLELLGEAGFQRVAVTLAPGAIPLPALRRSGTRGKRVVLLFGNEADGLPPAWETLCDSQVTLPMQRGVDSLNVATAAAIFLYEFLQLPGH